MPIGEIAILVGGLILLAAICYALDRFNKRAQQEREAQSETEIATIVERSDLTGFGALWTVVFFMATVVSFIGGVFSSTVFQQIEASLSSIANLILFGVAFAVLRRRTYKIYRSGPQGLNDGVRLYS
jgi:uncharacterized membrane protein